MAHLDPAERSAFERDGYLILPGVFAAHEVAAMRADADFILELEHTRATSITSGSATGSKCRPARWTRSTPSRCWRRRVR